MLVLSRKLNQRILIGGDICITVVRIDGDKIRLGIEAPKEIAVNREETLQSELLHILPFQTMDQLIAGAIQQGT